MARTSASQPASFRCAIRRLENSFESPVTTMPGCSYSPVSDQAIRLRRPALGLYQLAIHQTLGDLHRVECGAFAQVVRYDPHLQAVFDRCIFSDAADKGRILADALIGSDIAAVLALVDDKAARGVAQNLA